MNITFFFADAELIDKLILSTVDDRELGKYSIFIIVLTPYAPSAACLLNAEGSSQADQEHCGTILL